MGTASGTWSLWGFAAGVSYQIDVSTAAFIRLNSWPDFRTMVGSGLIGTDAADTATLGEKIAQAWLFQGLSDDGTPFRDPVGSGQSVVVLNERTEWTVPNQHNSARFPALQVLIYTDSTRDGNGAPVIRDAERKAKLIARRIDRCFHRPGLGIPDRFWYGMRVHSALRGAPISVMDVPGSESCTVRTELRYDLITD